MLSLKDRFANLGVMIGVAALATIVANVDLFGAAAGSLGPLGVALGPGLVGIFGAAAQYLIDLLKGEEKKEV